MERIRVTIGKLLCTVNYVNWIPAVLVVFIRCCTTAINYTAYLQSMEVYPTCIRQTGTAFGSLAAGALTAMAPYIVHLVSKESVRRIRKIRTQTRKIHANNKMFHNTAERQMRLSKITTSNT